MSTDYPNAWPNYPCDDNMPDMCDQVVCDAASELACELDDLLRESKLFKEWARESVTNNIPHAWDDMLDVGELTEEVMEQVIDDVKWCIKNKHLC